MPSQDDLILALEERVDASNLSAVLLALARVCDEKSEHLLINWKDKLTAGLWDRAARKLDRLGGEDSTVITLS